MNAGAVLILGFSVLLFAAGLSFLLADLLKAPTSRTSKAFINAVKRYEKKEKGASLDRILENLALVLSRFIRLGENRKADLTAALAAANMGISPELHVANCIIKALLVALLSFPALFIFPVFAPVILALAAGIFYSEYSSPERRIAAVREEIEFELPLLVSRIQSMLGHTRDVVAILDSYRKNAGPSLARELTVTVADMQSGNGAEALSRLENRVGSPAMSDIARGLSSVMEGNDPVGYWTALSVRLADDRRQKLLRRARAVPGKINRLSFCLMCCIIIIYAAVICTELLSSMGVLLG